MTNRATMTVSNAEGRSVVVIGAGGNIGSHLVPHLARAIDVRDVTLIDRDVYEHGNLFSQDITPRDIGRRKAVVQGRRLARINADLRIRAIADAVERVPLGLLRADVILACLDSRRARAYVNQAAWRLGVPWIDAGVEADGMLARVNVYLPGSDSACLECGWDEQDYLALEQVYPCMDFTEGAYRTNAPSSLGALAASMQAIECAKVLNGELELAAVGQQVLIGATHHKHYVTSYKRNPECRLFGHETWKIKKLDTSPRQLTVREAVEMGKNSGLNGSAGLRIESSPFVRRLRCVSCGHSKPILRLQNRLRPSDETCAHCGKKMVAAGRDLSERLERDSLPAKALDRSLHQLGFLDGDVFSVGSFAEERHFEFEVERV